MCARFNKIYGRDAVGGKNNNDENRRGGLVLSRRVGERVLVGDLVTVEVLDIRGGQARLRFEAPKDMEIWREEVLQRIKDLGETD